MAQSYLSARKQKPVPSIHGRVYRAKQGSVVRELITIPYYHRVKADDNAQEFIKLPEVRAFLDYCWTCGALPPTFPDPDIKRETWELHIFYDFIHDPLERLLTRHTLNQALESKTLNPWELPPSVLESALPEIFNRASRHEQTYVAYCPLLGMKEPSDGAWPLGPHVLLRFYSHLERLQYLTRHAENIPVQGLSSLSLSQDLGRMDIPLLEISITVNREDHHPPGGRARMFSEIIEERLADALDVAKWSLMLGFQVNTPLQEATITYEDALGGTLPQGFGVFPRQGRSSGILYEFEEEKIAQCRAWFAMIQAARALNPSVRQALWYWGRSALHRLDRDILLDSVIGLESLLVPNPGESTYRFGLHGAALLAASAEESIAIAKELRRLYGQRSRAAHGSPSERYDDAWKAFGHLSRAIAALAEVLYSSMIQSSPKADVAMQLEELVLRRAILRPREGS